MIEFLAFLSLVAIAAAIISAGCVMFRLATGRFPAWFYGVVFAWWWPVRKESALTIAASLFDDDEECTAWRYAGRFDGHYSHGPTGLKVRMNFDGHFSRLVVDGTNAEADSWGAYSLITALGRWERRRRNMEIVSADRKAAEAVYRAYGVK